MVAELRTRLEHEDSEVRDRTTVLRGDAREVGGLLSEPVFDVVLCHGVLMYHSDDGPLLDALCGVLAPGGVLSLLVRNAAALAMRPGLQGDWTAAGAAFDSGTYRNRLGVTARAHRVGELERAVRARGLVPLGWYGVRVFTDTAADDAPLPADLDDLLAVEERAGRTDPYRAVAALAHLLAVRP
jgi:SAM-dependent methyltransferase